MRMKRGNNRVGLGKKLSCSGSELAPKEFWIIDDLDEPVVPAVQGQVATQGELFPRCARKCVWVSRYFQRNSSSADVRAIKIVIELCD
jgi:hypothetical protein